MAEMDESDEMISELFEYNSEEKKEEKNEILTQFPVLKYQLPVRVGQKGKNLDEGDEPWIVGKFYPGKYLNSTHPEGHNGVDLKAPKGTPIYPIAPGKIILIADTPKGGKNLKIAHEDGQVVSYYAHLDSISVSNGQKVSQSTIIGAVGDTGNAKGRGAHLHYEVKVNGNHIDPLNLTGKIVGSLTKKEAKENYEWLEKCSYFTVIEEEDKKIKKIADELRSLMR
jgi:murein DD-endopeptidase MepM/ murein hydrolase activator NlpD